MTRPEAISSALAWLHERSILPPYVCLVHCKACELANYITMLETRLEHVERTIDEEMIVCHLGTFEREDDPKVAIQHLMNWAQGVGEYFATHQ
jgi:hypothetical protein